MAAKIMVEKTWARLLFAIVLSIFAISCQQKNAVSTTEVATNEQSEPAITESKKENVTVSQKGCSKTQDGVVDLPYSFGKTFSTLDEYLAHLKQLAAVDLPYWREVRPDVFEQVIHMTGAKPETATRDELMERYCFNK